MVLKNIVLRYYVILFINKILIEILIKRILIQYRLIKYSVFHILFEYPTLYLSEYKVYSIYKKCPISNNNENCNTKLIRTDGGVEKSIETCEFFYEGTDLTVHFSGKLWKKFYACLFVIIVFALSSLGFYKI